MYTELFKTYFNGYCKKTPKKITSATERYADDASNLKKVTALLPDIIKKFATTAASYFVFSIDITAHIFVGLYAPNAFVDHRADIYFAVEKLLPDPDLLEVIVTHEFIHSYHYHLLGRAGIDWEAIDWSDVRNSMYLEGVATYLSQKLVPGHTQSVYFSYNLGGEDWLSFCQRHQPQIGAAFLADLAKQPQAMEKGWFRLSGGQRFGYSRVGYFLGTAFVAGLCKELPVAEVLTLLADNRVSEKADDWLRGIVG